MAVVPSLFFFFFWKSIRYCNTTDAAVKGLKSNRSSKVFLRVLSSRVKLKSFVESREERGEEREKDDSDAEFRLSAVIATTFFEPHKSHYHDSFYPAALRYCCFLPSIFFLSSPFHLFCGARNTPQWRVCRKESAQKFVFRRRVATARIALSREFLHRRHRTKASRFAASNYQPAKYPPFSDARIIAKSFAFKSTPVRPCNRATLSMKQPAAIKIFVAKGYWKSKTNTGWICKKIDAKQCYPVIILWTKQKLLCNAFS